MTVSAQEQKKVTGHTCPNYQPDFSGYCQECYQRTDCMLRTVLRKLERHKSKPKLTHTSHPGSSAVPSWC
jgi:hypothetical protein